jgi:hypothetical protein
MSQCYFVHHKNTYDLFWDRTRAENLGNCLIYGTALNYSRTLSNYNVWSHLRHPLNVSFFRWGLVSAPPNPQFGEPSLIVSPWIVFQRCLSLPWYLQWISYVQTPSWVDREHALYFPFSFLKSSTVCQHSVPMYRSPS